MKSASFCWLHDLMIFACSIFMCLIEKSFFIAHLILVCQKIEIWAFIALVGPAFYLLLSLNVLGHLFFLPVYQVVCWAQAFLISVSHDCWFSIIFFWMGWASSDFLAVVSIQSCTEIVDVVSIYICDNLFWILTVRVFIGHSWWFFGLVNVGRILFEGSALLQLLWSLWPRFRRMILSTKSFSFLPTIYFGWLIENQCTLVDFFFEVFRQILRMVWILVSGICIVRMLCPMGFCKLRIYSMSCTFLWGYIWGLRIGSPSGVPVWAVFCCRNQHSGEVAEGLCFPS